MSARLYQVAISTCTHSTNFQSAINKQQPTQDARKTSALGCKVNFHKIQTSAKYLTIKSFFLKHNQLPGPVQASRILTGRMRYQYVVEMEVVVQIMQLHSYTSHGQRVPEHTYISFCSVNFIFFFFRSGIFSRPVQTSQSPAGLATDYHFANCRES